MVDYVGRIFRPPSEAPSFLLQVTVGCSHNRCAYCDMYRDKQFRPKSWDTIAADIAEAAAMGPRFRRVFLCDGDALILPTRKLLPVLEAIKEQLPWVERVGVYGDTRSVGRKSVEELTALREAGLGIVYHGMESGDDETLTRIDKGGTAEQCVDTAHKLRAAGLRHSVMVLLGIGGKDRTREHAQATARVLSEMDPPYVGALTTTVVPGTPLAQMEARGEFELPEKFELLTELREIVAGSNFSACRFSANHASNYLPLRADLPSHKPQLVAMLDQVLEVRDEALLKPEALRGL
ncbi:MAG: radical SAM protein [Deltaproteobacteria bacterium]|nr:radical SAM protein [Deltaproteobacteria bacterium]